MRPESKRGGAYQPGTWVQSAAGSDAGKIYLVLGQNQGRVQLWDGKRHRLTKLKQKNPRHLALLEEASLEGIELANQASSVQDLPNQYKLEARLRQAIKEKRATQVRQKE